MSAPTPGPWTQGDMAQVDAEFVYAGGIPIADFGLIDDLPEALANARLAAAAPELLVALQGVLRVADRKTDEFDAARAAVAKATGAA